MAVCPRCGGRSSQLLAPGYFECTSGIEEIVDLVPAHAHPGTGDIPIYGTRVCGNRYQSGEGAATMTRCACGMFAVGACVECNEPLCGEHVLRPDGRVLCSRHAAAVERAREERERQRTVAEQSRQEKRWLAAAKAEGSREIELARRLEAIEDPTERLVRAVVEIGKADTPELARHIPDSWDDREIGAWFARAAKVPPKEWKAGPLVRKPGQFRRRRYRSWHFTHGSRAIKRYPAGMVGHAGIHVMDDGRVYYSHGDDFEPAKDDGFRKEVLGEMWHLAELEPLDPHRRPPDIKAFRLPRMKLWE